MWGTEAKKNISERAFAAKLADGAWVVIRHLKPADAEAVLALHDALNQRERYLRFFTMQPVRLRALAGQLTNGRGDDFALGAFESGTLIGVANYAMCGKPATAEVAVVVSHGDQRRGVGTLMLRRLAQIAQANGIQHLVADVLTCNHLLFRVLRDAGMEARRVRTVNGVVHMDVDLSDVAKLLDED
ncbi:GNAT family N-acetyltransferase [Mycobacterium sp.]|uniref:GNAT family N-acetyltransferase n=1 Tax=Mycobacterium sp. TaxID=1785 RepID=UPI0025D22F17|nr:GNAT family N-acetyltransferase [Mycobacterium sp.]